MAKNAGNATVKSGGSRKIRSSKLPAHFFIFLTKITISFLVNIELIKMLHDNATCVSQIGGYRAKRFRLPFQSKFKQSKKTTYGVRIALRSLALNISDRSQNVKLKSNRTHPHQVFRIMEKVLSKHGLGLCQILTEKILTSRAFVQRIMNVDFFWGRQLHVLVTHPEFCATKNCLARRSLQCHTKIFNPFKVCPWA